MKEFKRRDSLSILNKDERIAYLEDEVSKLARFSKNEIPFQQISKEAQLNYEDIRAFGYAQKIISDFNKVDTIPEFNVVWNDSITKEKRNKDEVKLKRWLQFKLNLDTISMQSSIEKVSPKISAKAKS